jgi:asparagine synthase (glutamine-hydrolysing)
MCGIAAIIHPSDRRSRFALVSRMTQRLSHRGDGGVSVSSFGHASFGSARLPIIDPLMGNQPMETGELAIVFNGEIYNHREIRVELEALGIAFASSCDTEVLLHGYSRWGTAILTRLRGMYAFVIVNKVSGAFFAARDPFGIKPLYFAEVDGAWHFSSEVFPLLDLPGDSIKAFPPGGHMLDGIIHEAKSCGLSSHTGTMTAAIHEFREQFSASVERHLPPGDEPVAIFCSGGIDSSALAYEAVQVCERRGWDKRKKLALYSIGTRFAEDPKFARRLAKVLDVPFFVEEINAEQMVHTVSDAVDTIESFEPNHIRAGTASIALARRVRRDGYRIALLGEGADELLGGYEEFPDAVRRHADQEAGTLLNVFTQQLHLTQLRRVDRTTMKFGIEARVPFLDYDFARFIRGLPLDYKVHRRADGSVIGKHALREAYRGRLPDEFVDRKKVPMGEGSGIGDNRPSSGLFDDYADRQLSDKEYVKLVSTYPRFRLKTKEEAYYFSLFLQRFGNLPFAQERPMTNVMATT